MPIDVKTYEFRFRYERRVNITNGISLTYESKTFRAVQVAEVDEGFKEVLVIATTQ